MTALYPVLVLLVLGQVPPLPPEPPSGPIAPETARTLLGEIGAGSRVAINLEELCDGIGGRTTGTRTGREAEEWAAGKFLEMGLTPRFEKFALTGWEPVHASLAVKEAARDFHPLALGNTPSTPEGGVTASLVDAAHGTPADFERLARELPGRIVLVSAGTPSGERPVHRIEKVRRAARSGAAGLLFVSDQPGNLPQIGACWMGGMSPIPAVALSLEEGSWLRRRLQRSGRVEVTLAIENRVGPALARNVIAEIPAVPTRVAALSPEPEEVVLVTAHLDSWTIGTGCLDNGSGVAALLEAARALSASRFRPRRAIRFALFMGEELGLLGSRAYVEEHRGDLRRVRAVINLDMAGAPVTLNAGGHDEAIPFLREVARILEPLGVEREIRNAAGMHSDHQPFLLEGLPTPSIAFRFENDAGRFYHTAGDSLDKVAPEGITRGAAAVALLAAALAEAPHLPLYRYGPAETRAMLSAQGLEEALRAEGDWPEDR